MEDQLIKWMQEFVEVPHPALGNFPPCPYARQARISNKITFVHGDPRSLISIVHNNLYLLDDKDVLIIWFDHTQVDHVVLSSMIQSYNRLLMPDNYVILEDHPDDVEHVNGVKMNFGQCGLLLVQLLEKLNTAADQLRAKGYYDHWDQAALEQVVDWRYKHNAIR